MTEILGVRDVLEQLNTRLSNVEQDLRQIGARQDTTTRWLVGLILVSWLSMMASIWLRP